MPNNDKDKLPYRSEKWVGSGDLTSVEHSFLFDTITLVSRGEELIECGIFSNESNTLFTSAVIDMLILTRSLLEKWAKVKELPDEHMERLKLIKYFRDGLCHTESWRSKGEKVKYRITYMRANYDGSFPWISVKDGTPNIDKQLYLEADDICLYIGDKGLWINKDLITTFNLAKDYFVEKLPDDYNFLVRCRNFSKSFQGNP